MNFKELSLKVVGWAEERGIFTKGDPLAQLKKTQEELDETVEAVEDLDDLMHQSQSSTSFDELGGVIDGIGDMLVTVIIFSKMMNLDPEECLQAAYNEIKDRTGKMVGGQFVKDK